MAQETTSTWSWKVSPEELKEQLEGYHTLKVTQSYRGITVLLISALITLSLVLGFFEVTSLEDVIYSLIIYIPLLAFVYNGHKWAIIALFILWTIEKIFTLIYSVEAGSSPIGSIIWFLIVAPVIYKAYVVEKARGENIDMHSNNEVLVTGNATFCPQCGKSLNQQSKFCSQCGKELIS